MFVLYVIVFLTIENKNPYDVSKIMNIHYKTGLTVYTRQSHANLFSPKLAVNLEISIFSKLKNWRFQKMQFFQKNNKLQM